jgi:hypothetical protein
MVKYGCVVLGIYLSGQVSMWAVNLNIDGVVIAYTSQSSIARRAIESFGKSHRQFEESLREEREDVTVKLTQEKGSKSYKIRQIVEGGNVIYQAIDTTEEFWCILREFGPGTEFTCDDVLHSSVLEIDGQALRDFVQRNIITLPLNNRANIEMALFFGVLMDHFNHDPTLLLRVLRELQAIARMEHDTAQWPREERQALIRHAEEWLGLEEGDLRALDLSQLGQGGAGEPAAQKNLRSSARIKAPHSRGR